MKKKNLLGIVMIMVSLIGCGNIAEDTFTENVENTQVESIETTPIESIDMESSDVNEPAIDEIVYTEKGNLFLLENVVHNTDTDIDMNALVPAGRNFELVKSITIYHTDAAVAGYTKEDFLVRVVTSNAEWSYCDFGATTENYLVKTDELLSAISDKDMEMLIAASATPTPAPVQIAESAKPETSAAETPKVETPKVESTPAVSKPVMDIPVVATPVEEQPVVVESDKYTPEEAISIYRSIMESNGITWDPSIKEFASWGTGFMYLDKGYPEWAASTDLEACAMGDTVGNPVTLYYLEVTGSDENCVYITGWHSTN